MWRGGVRWLQGISVTAALVVLLSPTASAAVPATSFADWSVPQRVMTGLFNDRVSAAVDPAGHVYLAATRQGDLWFATDRTGAWVAKRLLQGTESAFWEEASIALDEQGRVHIVAVQGSPSTFTGNGIWYLTDSGRTQGTFPSEPTRIAPPGNDQPTVRASHGHLFVVDVNGACCGHDGAVQLRTNVTGSWTVSPIGTGDTPAFELGTDGLSQVVYDRFDKKPGIYFAQSAAASGGFTRTRVTGTGDADFYPLIALDTSNVPSIAWKHFHGSHFDIETSRDGTGGWQSASTAASSLSSGASVDFALDSLGRPMVAYGSKSVTALLLKKGAWRQATVTSSTHVYALALRAGPDGHAVVAWTSDEKSDGGVWVSRH